MRVAVLFNTIRYSMALLVICSAGCSKNEHAIEQPNFTDLEIKAITADPLLLHIKVDETLLTDSLVSPNGVITVPVKYTNPKHHFRVTDQLSNRLLTDTVINYQPGEKNTISFFQATEGAGVFWVGPPVNEPLPPAYRKKISLVYTLPEPVMPDEVKVIVMNTKDNETSGYVLADSFLLKRGEFSRCFLSWERRKSKLTIIKNVPARDTLAFVESTRFADAIGDFSVFYINSISQRKDASLTKLY